MNAMARKAELSKMIDGTNYSYRYKAPYVRTQLAIAMKAIVKNPDIKKQKSSKAPKVITTIEHSKTQYKLYTSSKQMKLASYCWISCSNIRRKKERAAVCTYNSTYRRKTSF